MSNTQTPEEAWISDYNPEHLADWIDMSGVDSVTDDVVYDALHDGDISLDWITTRNAIEDFINEALRA